MAVSATSLETAELHLRAADAALRVSACAARTDRGVSRALNEDAVLVAGPLLAVADGVGGHSAGEEASAIAVDALRRHVGVFGDDPGAELARALRCANADVRAAARAPGRAGMATTMVAALVAGASVTVAHVGDSRAYLSHEGRLQRLTVDLRSSRR